MNCNSLPPKLTHLMVYGHMPEELPESLVYFHFGCVSSNKVIEVIPSGIKTFVCDVQFLYIPHGAIYKSVERLILYGFGCDSTADARSLNIYLSRLRKNVSYYFPNASLSVISSLQKI